MKNFLRFLSLVLLAALLAAGILSNSSRIWLAVVFLSAIPIGYLVYSMIPRQAIGWRRNAWKISATIFIGFALLSMQLLHEQYIEASVLANDPIQGGNGEMIVNPRVYEQELRIQRGRIYGRNGVELAGRVVTSGGLVKRTYPVPEASYLIGYHTPSFLYGNSGLEKRYNDYLMGRKGNPIGSIESRLLHRPLVGDDMYLTLDADLQKQAQQLLGDRQGAIIVMNPQTGEILAMVSNPAYNANDLVFDPSKSRSQEIERIQDAYNKIASSGDSRFLNRATQGLYSPGSTFKTVVAAAALDSGKVQPDSVYKDDGSYTVEGHVIEDPNRPDKDKTKWTFSEAYRYSLNAVFAQVALQLHAAGLIDYAHRFMYGKDIPFDLPVSVSQLANDPDNLSNQVLLASTGFGQGEILTTPLEILLNTATIANGGVMPRPYLVSEIKNSRGQVVFNQGSEPLNTVISPQTADTMKGIMVETVDHGSGYEAKIPGIKVGGKTGTAQLPSGRPHAWFTAFAPAKNPQVAVVVLVEHGGEGYDVAAPIAKQLIMSALHVQESK